MWFLWKCSYHRNSTLEETSLHMEKNIKGKSDPIAFPLKPSAEISYQLTLGVKWNGSNHLAQTHGFSQAQGRHEKIGIWGWTFCSVHLPMLQYGRSAQESGASPICPLEACNSDRVTSAQNLIPCSMYPCASQPIKNTCRITACSQARHQAPINLCHALFNAFSIISEQG